MIGAPEARSWHRTVLVGAMSLMSVAAWLAISQFGTGFHAAVHHQPRTADSTGLLFLGSWMVMTIAMMLPTTIPVVATFHTIAAQRPDRPVLIGLVLAGYLLMWGLVGVLFWAAGMAVQSLTWWRAPGIGGAAALVAAGAYQFTPLKRRCLDKCRSPLSLVLGYWQGQHHRRNAIRLGLHHGLFCVGCCWALMLLMFAVGLGNLGWMLVLGAVMAAEKNLSWGRRLSAPVGLLLLAGGFVLWPRG